MSFTHVRHRKDKTKDDIVEGLEKAGYVVGDDTCVDLQVRHPTWPLNIWCKLENKSKNRKEGFAPRKDQQAQTNYCFAHGIPYVFSAEDALQYLQIWAAQNIRRTA